MTRQTFLVVVVFALAVTLLLPVSAVAKVIDFDDDFEICREVGRIDFQGNLFFPINELRQALAEDPAYQFAAHPATSMDEFIAIVHKRLLAGYQRNGFPEPKISVIFDLQKKQVIAEIDSGQQFRKGKIEITSDQKIDRKLVENWILKERPPADASPVTIKSKGKTVTRWVKDGGSIARPLGPSWEVGSPATFYPPDFEAARIELRRCCATQGYFSADVSVGIRCEDDATATLVVAVNDAGDQATLDDIEVVGLKRDTVEDLLEFLNLRTGMPITSTTNADVVRKLFESGKFLESKVKFEHKKDASVFLKITLCENDNASSLMQPATEVELVSCRLAGWLNQLPESDEELELVCDSIMELHFVWSFRERAFLGRIVHRAKDGGPAPFGFEFLADETGITANALHRGLQVSLPRVDRQIMIQMFGSTHAPDAQGHSSRLLFGAGQRAGDSYEIPVTAEILIPPAMIIRGFSDPKTHFTIEDGRAILLSDESRFEIELDSGRLVEFSSKNEKFGTFRIATGENLMRTALADYHRRVDTFTSVNEQGRHFTSLVRFLPHAIDPVQWNLEKDSKSDDKPAPSFDRADKALQKLVSSATLKPLDDYLSDWFDSRNWTRFRLPVEERRTYNFFLDEGQKLIGLFVPHESWLYRVTRDWNVVRNNTKSPTSEQILRALKADAKSGKLGPLASWYAFAIGSSIRYPGVEVFAKAAGNHMDIEYIQREINEILQPGITLADMIDDLIAAAGNCSVDEWSGLAEFLCPEHFQREFLEVGRICRENETHPHDAVPVLVECLYPRLIEPTVWKAIQPRTASSRR